MSLLTTRHVIETDFEPDDLIAIKMHACKSNDVILTVIVGEGRPNDKIPHVQDFLNKLCILYPNAYKTIDVVQGLGSEKAFPVKESTVIRDTDEVILANYVNVYATNPNVVYMMKPPREAMLTKVDCHLTRAICYGSFNWRTLGLKVTDFRDLMSRYLQFTYFDSFSVIGQDNSFSFVGKANAVDDQIRRSIFKWNTHQLNTVENALKTETDPGKIERKLKIINNIKKSVEDQYVAADVCLFGECGYTHIRPVILIDFNKDGYPIWAADENSSRHCDALLGEGLSDAAKKYRRDQLIAHIDSI